MTSEPCLLVVEDHDELRTAVADLLTAAGYTVRTARNADEACVVLESMPRPCLVLWDPVSVRTSLSLLARRAFEGIRIATLPIGIALAHHGIGGDGPEFKKKLTSHAALFSVVRDHCADPVPVPV
jgi:CheY-like chemotaxis protein